MPASRRPAYLPRRAEPLVRRALNQHRVVAVVGARQIGKTTLVRRVCEATGGTYVDLEDPGVLKAVALDPTALFQGRRPIVIDEFQHGGDALLRAVKRWVDQRNSPGQVLFTGATRFTTVPMISESLAGRVVLLDLWPLSQGEVRQASDGFVSAVFGPASRLKAFAAPPDRTGTSRTFARSRSATSPPSAEFRTSTRSSGLSACWRHGRRNS